MRTFLTLCGILLSTQTATASIFDTFGFSSRAAAMGNAQVAIGSDYDATYYNPANILSLKRTRLGLGLNLIAPALSVERDSGEEPLEALTPDNDAGFHLGVSTPIGGVFENRLGFGLAFFHPLTSGTRISSIDPATPHFYRFQDLPDKLVVAAALAFEPFDWLRLGAGVQILAALSGDVAASLSVVEGRFTSERIDVDIDPAVSPTVGVSVGPFEGLRFGATWRSALDLAYDIPVVATIEGIGDLNVDVSGTSLYTPGQLALGVSWESAPQHRPGLALEAGVTWALWSDAPPAGARFVLTIDDSEVRPPTDPQDSPELVVDVRGEHIALGAKDTLTPRIGCEWRIDDVWTVRGGWFWRPTPLPRPVHQTNSLDASANVLALGGGISFKDPTDIHDAPINLDASVQLTLLSERTAVKSAQGTPDGVYRFGGAVWSFSIDFRHDYF